MGANFVIGAGKPASEGDVEVDSMIIAGVVAVVGVKEPLFDFSRAGVIGVPIETISLLEREEGTKSTNEPFAKVIKYLLHSLLQELIFLIG
jgi:hypothetical protein